VHIHYMERVLCDNEVVFQRTLKLIEGTFHLMEPHFVVVVIISHEEAKTIAIRMKGQCPAHEG
jgi:hypothetical protein